MERHQTQLFSFSEGNGLDSSRRTDSRSEPALDWTDDPVLDFCNRCGGCFTIRGLQWSDHTLLCRECRSAPEGETR